MKKYLYLFIIYKFLLVERVFILGKPRRLHSDRGSEFINEIKITAFYPQGNSYAERIHQFFRNALTAF